MKWTLPKSAKPVRQLTKALRTSLLVPISLTLLPFPALNFAVKTGHSFSCLAVLMIARFQVWRTQSYFAGKLVCWKQAVIAGSPNHWGCPGSEHFYDSQPFFIKRPKHAPRGAHQPNVMPQPQRAVFQFLQPMEQLAASQSERPIRGQ